MDARLPISMYDESELEYLQARTFRITVVMIGLLSQLLILFCDLYFRPSPFALTASLLLLFLGCVTAFTTYIYRPRHAKYGFTIFLWLWIALFIPDNIPVMTVMFASLTLVGLGITNPLFSTSLAVAACAWIAHFFGASHSLTPWVYIFLIGFVLVIGLVVFRSLIEALKIAGNYQNYAVRQMEEARSHRQELMRLAKALGESQENFAHLNVQLQYAHAASENARRLKAQFAANVSHEFRTPINLIVGFSEVIVNSPHVYNVPLPRAYRSDIHTIYESAKHLQTLINDVLDVSQIETGHMAVLKEQGDIARVASEAAALTRDMIERRGLTLNVEIPEALSPLWFDPVRVRQVVLNLLSNAARFTDTGAITLRVTEEAETLRIAVIDTGVGITEQDLARVFDEFYQIESLREQRRGGVGLGLTVSKQLVELHGGKLFAESEGVPGKGTTFTILLPRQPQPHPSWQMRVQSSAVAAPREGKCFIVVDDDPAVVRLFERYADKHNVLGIQSVEEIHDLIEKVQPSALVVDEAQQWQERRALQEIIESINTPIAIIECPMPSGRRAMQSYGVADYLVKPVSQETLLGALKRLSVPVRSLLIIDDDPDVARMFRLMTQGMPDIETVWVAYSGQEGLALMRHHVPDAVLLDLLMPDVDGFSVIQLMKMDEQLCNIPIVIASARGGGEAIQPSARGKLSISKVGGFHPAELVHSIEALIDTITPYYSTGAEETPVVREAF